MKLSALLWRFRHIVAATALGLAVTIAINYVLSHVETQSVVVAVTEIAPGQTITAQHLKLTDIPSLAIPSEVTTSITDIVGKPASIRLSSGTILIPSMVVTPKTKHKIPTNNVIVTVPIEPASAELIAPGVHINLYSAPDPETCDPESYKPDTCQANLVAENVVVLSVSNPDSQLVGNTELAHINVSTKPGPAKTLLGAITKQALQVARL